MEASEHRYNAREALRGNWVNAVIVALLVNIIGNVGPSVNINFESNQPVQITAPEQLQTLLNGTMGIAMSVVLVIALVLAVAGMVLGGVMELGSARYNLNLIDRRNAEVADLFTGFPRFSAALVMNLLSQVLTTLGFLLFIVPGFMLQYGYAMAPYILAEDPDCTGWEALQRSREMMRGHKLELWWLELSFLGWGILAGFTFGIGSLFLQPYINASRASFYRDLSRYPAF